MFCFQQQKSQLKKLSHTSVAITNSSSNDDNKIDFTTHLHIFSLYSLLSFVVHLIGCLRSLTDHLTLGSHLHFFSILQSHKRTLTKLFFIYLLFFRLFSTTNSHAKKKMFQTNSIMENLYKKIPSVPKN